MALTQPLDEDVLRGRIKQKLNILNIIVSAWVEAGKSKRPNMLVLHLCFTCASLVLHLCFSCASIVLHLCLCFTCASLVLHLCFTTCASLVLHLCFCCASVVLHLCFNCTWAPEMLHCFELCFVRPHWRRKAQYGNLVYMYVYRCILLLCSNTVVCLYYTIIVLHDYTIIVLLLSMTDKDFLCKYLDSGAKCEIYEFIIRHIVQNMLENISASNCATNITDLVAVSRGAKLQNLRKNPSRP